jgi:phage baseplate assembly protein W
MANGLSEGKELLGAGIAFPFRVDAQGHMAMNSLEDHVRQSILLILQTAKGERMMRRDFGSGLHDLVFEPLNAATVARVKHEVKDALVRFEPRIEVLKVEVTADSKQIGVLVVNGATVDPNHVGVLLIYIEYRVRETDAIFNLVYPFYLERGEL